MISQLFVSIHVHTYLYNYFNGIQRNAYIEDTPVLNRLIFVPMLSAEEFHCIAQL